MTVDADGSTSSTAYSGNTTTVTDMRRGGSGARVKLTQWVDDVRMGRPREPQL